MPEIDLRIILYPEKMIMNANTIAAKLSIHLNPVININAIPINKPSVEYVSDLRCLPPEISTGEFSFNPFFTQI
jgi:hypothetical protein